jgi:hypothetical protein
MNPSESLYIGHKDWFIVEKHERGWKKLDTKELEFLDIDCVPYLKRSYAFVSVTTKDEPVIAEGKGAIVASGKA